MTSKISAKKPVAEKPELTSEMIEVIDARDYEADLFVCQLLDTKAQREGQRLDEEIARLVDSEIQHNDN